MKLARVFALPTAAFLVMAAVAFSAAPAAAGERILVAVGYTDIYEDLWEKSGIPRHTYAQKVAAGLTALVAKELGDLGYMPSPTKNIVVTSWTSPDSSLTIDVVNPNSTCPETTLDKKGRESRPSNFGCYEQREKSKAAADYVRTQIFSYDAFLFVGHARYGTGLAFGHFNDTSAKVDIKDVARKFHGAPVKLRVAALLTCGSYGYYKNSFDSLYDAKPPAFIGVNDLDATWADQAKHLPTVLRALSGGVAQYAEALPAKSAFAPSPKQSAKP